MAEKKLVECQACGGNGQTIEEFDSAFDTTENLLCTCVYCEGEGKIDLTLSNKLREGERKFREMSERLSDDCFQLVLRHGVNSIDELKEIKRIPSRLIKYKEEIESATGRVF
jgi:hypothetical protein